MCHQAKFRPNRSNRCWNIAIYPFFFNTVAVLHFGFVGQILGRPTTRHLMVFITVPNSVAIALVVLIIQSLNILRIWPDNAYSRPFLAVLGVFFFFFFIRPLSHWKLISKLISKFTLISSFHKKISSVNNQLSKEINFEILFYQTPKYSQHLQCWTIHYFTCTDR